MARTVVHQDLKSMFGEEDLLEVAESRSFASMISELLSEKKPNPEEEKIFELCLNLSIDHGPDTPSAVKIREAAQSGSNLIGSLVAGIGEINDKHGGATEPCMEILYRIKSSEVSSMELVKEYLTGDKRMPGFGHRIYKDEDPRAQLILSKLKSFNLGEEFIKVALELETELQKQKGVKLPINVDGAIAVVLCTLGWSSKLGKAVFIIARTPGLCGQYLNTSV